TLVRARIALGSTPAESGALRLGKSAAAVVVSVAAAGVRAVPAARVVAKRAAAALFVPSRCAAGATPQIAATAEVAPVRRTRAVPAFALVLAARPVILVGAAAEDAGGEVVVALPALAVAGVAIGTTRREVAVDAVRLAGTAARAARAIAIQAAMVGADLAIASLRVGAAVVAAV